MQRGPFVEGLRSIFETPQFQRFRTAMAQASAISRRRRHWPLIGGILFVLLTALWSGFWYFGSQAALRALDGWKEREARSGRVYNCGTQDVGGFPADIEFRCVSATATLASNANRPPLALSWRELVVHASVFSPAELNAEIVGPLTLAEAGQPVFARAEWRKATIQLQGLPVAPQAVAVALLSPAVAQPSGESLFKADRLDINGRLVSGTVQNNPVVETVLKLVAASAPAWHQAATIPTDADITVVLRGLNDFRPKPWPQRFRELEAAGGRIEIVKARVQQRDVLAVANGALGLSPAGRLHGQLQLTVANLDKFLPLLGLDRMLSPEQASPQVNRAFDALDRLMPGLGNVARQNAAPAIAAGVNLMGKPVELEGRRAVELPLRFDDGMVSLGPLKIGMTPPLF
jgi:hypothetical protein